MVRIGAEFQDEREFRKLVDAGLGSDLIVIDGGARNGTRELRRLSPWIVAHGFEPSPAQYEPLRNDPGLNYKRMIYHPTALLDRTGEADLYVSKHPGATSTLRPNTELLQHFSADNWAQLVDIVGIERVSGVSIEDFMRQQDLTYVDYLKLDTQGNELDILRSSGEFLSHISVIKTEVELIPMYQGQALLGDIATYLAASGFDMIDLQWTEPCRRYHFSPDLPPSAYRLVWADAFFAYQPQNMQGPRKLEQALVLAELGFVDLALYILSRAPAPDLEVTQRLVSFYQRRKPPASRSRLKRMAARFIPEHWIDVLHYARRPLEKYQMKLP